MLAVPRRIDPHVHARDLNEAYKTTIRDVLQLAKEQGVSVIFAMPNTDPPILRRADVLKYVGLVPKGEERRFYLYIGVTADPKQLEEAVECYHDIDQVIGLKMYAGKSVGALAVIKEEEQRLVYKTLSKLGYLGPLAVHCEKEAFIKPELFNPKYPITHSAARPEIAEIESVKDQIKFAMEADFSGTLHVCHASCPETVDLVNEAKKNMSITCAVTPHHIMWSNEMLKTKKGLLYKTNPSLRNKKTVSGLRQRLVGRKIDFVETDHAPHTEKEKLNPPYLSGYPSLTKYKYFVEEFLPALGIGEEDINLLTCGNILGTFQIEY